MFKKIFMSEKIVLGAIIINAIIITWMSFPEYVHNDHLIFIDHVFIWFFLLEMLVKWRHLGFRNYFKDGWNVFDCILVVGSLPSILIFFFPGALDFMPETSLILVFRLFRLLRLFRFMRFIPHMDSILSGIGRAMKASVFVFIGLVFLNFMFALITCQLYGHLSPELFGDPLKSIYSIFQMFTIEGWYEIPEGVVSKMESSWSIWITRLYFVSIVMIGGILGMSLVNAIFVDEMTMDNNDNLEAKVDELQAQIRELKEIIQEKK